MSHNVRTSCEQHFNQGDKVYFKRKDNKRWHGSATVIGLDGKQVLVRYDSDVVRVHTARLTLADSQPSCVGENSNDVSLTNTNHELQNSDSISRTDRNGKNECKELPVFQDNPIDIENTFLQNHNEHDVSQPQEGHANTDEVIQMR